MTDLGIPSDERGETVSRVIAALSSGTTDGALGRGALRDALESEGQSLLDLPEVGLWLALTQISLTENESAIGTLADPPAHPEPLEPEPLERVIDLRAAALTVVDVVPTPVESAPLRPEPPAAPTVPAVPPTTAPTGRGRRRGRRRRLSTIVAVDPPVSLTDRAPWTRPGAPVVDGPAGEPDLSDLPPPDESGRVPDPTGLTELVELQSHLADALEDPLSLRLHDGAISHGATVLPSDHLAARALRLIGPVADYVDEALTAAISVQLPDPAQAGTAVPEPFLPIALQRSIHDLHAYLDDALRGPLVLDLHPATEPHGATLDPYWPRPVLRRLDSLASFLTSSFALPTEGRAAASRLAGAMNGAVPDPYWPRHLVRSSPSTPGGRPIPRSSEALEADLHDALDVVALVGEADLEPFAAEMEISLSRLVRRVPLDRLGRIYPATLAAFLVRQTMLHPEPSDFDAHIPVTALRRTNPVGLAFSEALIRLSKPVFREVEQRDEFDHRLRYLRRMQLHAGIPVSQLPPVLAAIDASYWAGAASGREVAVDWLLASSAVSASIGAPAFRLLTRTDHGGLMLEALVDLVRWRSLEPRPPEPPAGLEPLPARLVEAGWTMLQGPAHPDVAWGQSPRPRIRLAPASGAGPEVELPPSSSRWHLNGELLAYGSPTHRKSVPLPTSRGGKWTFTTGTTRRTSPFDIRVQSAAPDRVVLVFDELDRYHHHSLPLGGTRATVVVPAGSRVTGELDRTLLVGRWIGFESVEVGLTASDEIVVSSRGQEPVTIRVDHALDARLLGGHGDGARPLLVFRGHVPPPMTVEVAVESGSTRRSSLLTDVWVTAERDGYALDHLVEESAGAPMTVTVSRVGFESVSDTVTLPAVSAHPAVAIASERAVVPRALRRPIGDPLGEDADTAPTPAHLELVWHTLRDAARAGDEQLDDLWTTDPLRAAAADRWDIAGLERRSTGRWAAHAGWTPPTDPARADASLIALVRPVIDAIGGESATPAGWLTAGGWSAAIASDLDALDDWEQRHRRPLARWRSTLPSIKNLQQLWTPVPHSSRARIVLPVLTAGLVSFVEGPHRAAAAERLAEALGLAPTLTVSGTLFALAYAHVQRVHPETRFRTIALRRG